MLDETNFRSKRVMLQRIVIFRYVEAIQAFNGTYFTVHIIWFDISLEPWPEFKVHVIKWWKVSQCCPLYQIRSDTVDLLNSMVSFVDWTVPMWFFFCGFFFNNIFHVCLYYTVFPVLCSLLSPAEKGLTSWLSCDVLLCICHFPIRCLGWGVELDCSDSWFCLLLYF